MEREEFMTWWFGRLYLHLPRVTERIFCSSNLWQEGHLEGRTHFMSSWYLSSVDRIDTVIKMIKPQNTADKYIHLWQIIPSGFTRLSIHNCWCRWPFLPQAHNSYRASERLADLAPPPLFLGSAYKVILNVLFFYLHYLQAQLIARSIVASVISACQSCRHGPHQQSRNKKSVCEAC